MPGLRVRILVGDQHSVNCVMRHKGTQLCARVGQVFPAEERFDDRPLAKLGGSGPVYPPAIRKYIADSACHNILLPRIPNGRISTFSPGARYWR